MFDLALWNFYCIGFSDFLGSLWSLTVYYFCGMLLSVGTKYVRSIIQNMMRTWKVLILEFK